MPLSRQALLPAALLRPQWAGPEGSLAGAGIGAIGSLESRTLAIPPQG